MNYWITLKKAVLGFLAGLAAVVVAGVIKSITDYVPVACSSTVTENCLPGYLLYIYQGIVPAVIAGLVAFSNWLKHRND